MSRPATLPIPETVSHLTEPASSWLGVLVRATAGSVTTSPTSMTQATTELAPISRIERDEQRVEAAKQSAAPKPPRIAIKCSVSAEPGDQLAPEARVVGPSEKRRPAPVR